MNEARSQPAGIAKGGASRAREASEPRIREEVAREFQEELAGARGWQWLLVWMRMEREARRRVRKISSPWNLYLGRHR